MKRKLHYVLTRIFDTPLMVQRQKLDTILTVLRPRLPMMFEDSGYEPTPVDPQGESTAREETPVMDRVAVIPIHGVLVQRATGMAAMCGMMDYQVLTQMVADAAANPSVDAILLDIDSPGGEAHGCFEFADSIYEARGSKPIIAMVNEMACSAAYAIASAAHTIYVTKTAMVGSIGVIATHLDVSEADKMEGLKYTHVIAGRKKADWSEHEPLSERGRAALQQQVSSMYQIFVTTVARNRDIEPEAVAGTEAGLFMGKSGVTAGLADEVIPLSELSEKIQESIMAQKVPVPKQGAPAANKGVAIGANTNEPTENSPTPTPPTPPKDGSATNPTPPPEDNDGEEEETDEEDVTPPKPGTKQKAQKAVMVDSRVAADIIHACTLAGKPELASTYITEGLTADQAKARLFEAMANGEVQITSAVDPTAKPVDEASALLVNGMKHANESRARRR